MQLELSVEDQDLLTRLLEREIGDTRVEARHTDDRRYREQLERNEASLRDLLDRLRKASS